MKHAYLICAHSQFELLKKLIIMLDDKDNDIYIHIDKKSRNFLKSEFENICTYSKVHFTKRIKVYRGHSSQIEAELILLEAAIKGEYDYYHLLTGQDLPIKTRQEIKDFFENNNGGEFVSFDENDCKTNSFLYRLLYYHFYISANGLAGKIVNKLKKYSIQLQKIIGINRLKSIDMHFKKGSAYFDITHQLAEYIVHKMRTDKAFAKLFRYTSCGDEVFVQSILYNSDFMKNRFSVGTRYIDWSKHGDSPETLTSQYADILKNSKALFARKFDIEKEPDIIETIFNTYNR